MGYLTPSSSSLILLSEREAGSPLAVVYTNLMGTWKSSSFRFSSFFLDHLGLIRQPENQ